MIFEIKSDLPVATQNKIDYIEAIASSQRTTAQAAFLTALTPYRTNTIISVDENGLIIAASGLTVPTGYEGFAKGATFTKTDATGAGLYNNTGTTSSAVWTIIQDTDTDDNAVVEDTPANAVAASKVLTVAAPPAEGETVSMGGVTYKFRAAIGAGTAATGTITTDETLVADTATVMIGDVTYTFKTALTEPAVANEVLIGANYSDMLANLAAAINGATGAGTTYGTGTVAHPLVTAGGVDSGAFTVTAKSVGFAGNVDSTSSDAHLTWGSAKLTGGVDAEAANDVLIGDNAESAIDNLVLAVTAGETEGTNYGTGTVVNPSVTAVKASASTMTCSALVKGTAGNSIAIAETLANGASVWAGGATALSGGIAGTVGAKGELMFDTTNLYVCTAANTVNDANWKKLVLQTI